MDGKESAAIITCLTDGIKSASHVRKFFRFWRATGTFMRVKKLQTKRPNGRSKTNEIFRESENFTFFQTSSCTNYCSDIVPEQNKLCLY